jgi:hygromycin-B 4-O-kinase
MAKPFSTPMSIAALVGRLFPGAADFKPITGGEESHAFAIHMDGQSYVLRLNRSIEGFTKDDFAWRRLATPSLPIPAVIEIGFMDDGLAYCLSQLVPGMTLQELPPFELSPVLAPVAAVMGEIAASDASDLNGFGPFDAQGRGRYGSWRHYLTAVASPALYDWAALEARIDPAVVEACVETIVALAAHCPEVCQFVHGDFGSNNVLTDGRRITGVIDWSEAMIGDPLYDLANILFWRPWLACMERQARYFETVEPGRLRDVERLRCYQLRIGLEQLYQSARLGADDDVAWASARCREIMLTGDRRDSSGVQHVG